MVQIKKSIKKLLFFSTFFCTLSMAANDPYPGVRLYNSTHPTWISGLSLSGKLFINNGVTQADVFRFLPRNKTRSIRLLDGHSVSILFYGRTVKSARNGNLVASHTFHRVSSTDQSGRKVLLASKGNRELSGRDTAINLVNLAYDPVADGESVLIPGSELAVDFDITLTPYETNEFHYPATELKNRPCVDFEDSFSLNFAGNLLSCKRYKKQTRDISRRVTYFESEYVVRLYTLNENLKGLLSNPDAEFAYFFSNPVRSKVLKDSVTRACEAQGSYYKLICNGRSRPELLWLAK